MITKDEVRETLMAYANGRMRKYAAAKILHLDVSSLEYRLQKIRKITGLDPKNFFDLVKLIELTKEHKNEGTDV